MQTHTKEFLDSLTPQTAFALLMEGNKRFVNNLKLSRNLLQLMNETAEGQYPFAVALSCMDSRTAVELIFDQGLGDLFSIRIAGNIVNDDILGSMEYACQVVGSKLIVVLGHTRCGAIKGACDDVKMGNLTPLLEKIKPAIERAGRPDENPNTNIFPDEVGIQNVLHSIDEILERSDIIRKLYETGKIGIVGGMYGVETGRVEVIKELFINAKFIKSGSVRA